MTKVDTDDAAAFSVDHEVGEVAVSDPQDPVAHTQQGVGADEVGAQREKSLRTVAHLQERSPADRTLQSPPSRSASVLLCTYFRRSLGTRCTTFIKLLTASARLAFLETPKIHNGLLSYADSRLS